MRRSTEGRPRRWRRLSIAVIVGAFAAGVVVSWLLLASPPDTIRRTPPAQQVVRPPPSAPSPGPGHESIRGATAKRLLRFHLPVRCGGLRTRFVALTFDDGPGPYTPLALRILRRAHAGATFFIVGKELEYWPRLPRA